MSYRQNKDRFEGYKRLPNEWATPLMMTFCAAPCYCLFTALCPGCVAFQQRGRLLLYNWSRYQCCAGMMPCSGHLGERYCPQLCLCLEVTLCFSAAVQTTRLLLQQELQIRNAPCDNFIIGVMVYMQYLACVCDLLACMAQMAGLGGEEDFRWLQDTSVVIDQVAQGCYCAVCSCMQTQMHVELNRRDGVLGVRTAPIPQRMTRK